MQLVYLEALGVKVNVSNLSNIEAETLKLHWKHCVIAPHREFAETIERPAGPWKNSFELLTQSITNSVISKNLGEYMMFHAAGLQLPGTSGVLAFVAPSGTGKSTLTASLAKVMTYLSDEVVTVAKNLEVLPMQKPISLISNGNGSRKEHLGPAQLDLKTDLVRPARLASIFLLNRVTEEATPTLTLVPLDEAILALTPELSGLGLINNGLDWLCNMIQLIGGTHRLTYSEAKDLDVDLFTSYIKRIQGTSNYIWTHVSSVENRVGRKLSRSNFHDAIIINNRALILISGQVWQLGELATEIWIQAPLVESLRDLRNKLEEKFGSHIDSESLLQDSLGEMIAKNLIIRN